MYCVHIYIYRCMYMYIIYFQEARISNGPKPSKAQSVLFCFPSTRTLSKIIRRVFVTSKDAWGNLPCADVAANALVTCQLSIGFTTRDAFWMVLGHSSISSIQHSSFTKISNFDVYPPLTISLQQFAMICYTFMILSRFLVAAKHRHRSSTEGHGSSISLCPG